MGITKKLAAALKRDDEREDAGMHADDRATCFTHQSWAEDCEELHSKFAAVFEGHPWTCGCGTTNPNDATHCEACRAAWGSTS